MDGPIIFKKIRNHFHKIPIILISDVYDSGIPSLDRFNVKASLNTRKISMPFKEEELMELVENFLGKTINKKQ